MKSKDLRYQPLERWQDFESLCRDIFRLELNASNAETVGREGCSQNGVDVYLYSREKDESYGVQCKLRNVNRRLTRHEIQRDVEKAKLFKPALNKYCVATTALADPSIQEFVRQADKEHTTNNLFSIRIYFWDEINEFLNHHRDIASRYYDTGHLLAVALEQVIRSVEELGSLSSEGQESLAKLNHSLNLIREGNPQKAIDQMVEFLKGNLPGLSASQEIYLRFTIREFVLLLMSIALTGAVLLRYEAALDRLEKDRELLEKIGQRGTQIVKDHEHAEKHFDNLKKTWGIDKIKLKFKKLVKEEDLDYPLALWRLEKKMDSDLTSIFALEAVRETDAYSEFVWMGFLELVKIDIDKSFWESRFTKYPDVGERCAFCRKKLLHANSHPVLFIKKDGKYLLVSVEYIFCNECRTLVMENLKKLETIRIE